MTTNLHEVSPLISVREAGTVAVVELSRKEKRNALSMALRDRIEEVLGQLGRNDRIKAVVLTGGAGCFSAGFDLKELVESDLRSLMHRGREFTEAT